MPRPHATIFGLAALLLIVSLGISSAPAAQLPLATAHQLAQTEQGIDNSDMDKELDNTDTDHQLDESGLDKQLDNSGTDKQLDNSDVDRQLDHSDVDDD